MLTYMTGELIKLAEQQTKKVGIFKCGNIGTSPLLELLIDELADRKDIKVRTVTSGSISLDRAYTLIHIGLLNEI